MAPNHLLLHPRTQQLAPDERGRNVWRAGSAALPVPAVRTAVLVCDMWNAHWSRAATERVNELVPRMNQVLLDARRLGVHVIHAPSDTLGAYENMRARKRMLELPPITLPDEVEHDDPPQPVDASDGGSDSNHGDETPNDRVWTAQHPAIEIDDDWDVISDDGYEVYKFVRHRDIQMLAIMGVHTNMCVLGRSFGIKQMVRWGVPVVLVRDLTDAMYNPALPPYVSHDEGVRLIVEFIEKFWCPTIQSEDLTQAAPAEEGA